MKGAVLRLTEDRFGVNGRYGRLLPAVNRVLYLLRGELAVGSGGRVTQVRPNSAWHGVGECPATASPDGATVLRYELVRAGTPATSAPGVESRLLLEHPILLDPAEQYLMRCDRVDFELGGEALPHCHKGGGIRCLISGTLELRVGDEPPRIVGAGQAWFESGREPVYAAASRDVPTSFIRCAILPRAIKGKSSIVYVNPTDATRGKPRQYTMLVDEPIELP